MVDAYFSFRRWLLIAAAGISEECLRHTQHPPELRRVTEVYATLCNPFLRFSEENQINDYTELCKPP
jgi:hypothetical protein